jgi:integrase
MLGFVYNLTGGAAMNMKGNICKVDPITTLEGIAAIKQQLKGNQRNYAIFVCGINTAFRASDLVSLTCDQFQGVKVGDFIAVREQKTKKVRQVKINQSVFDAIQPILKDKGLLFPNRDGGKLCVETINRMVKGWCEKAGLSGNFGSHSLRKTWAHWNYMNGANECDISEALGHSSVKQTRIYLGIQAKAVQDLYMDCL